MATQQQQEQQSQQPEQIPNRWNTPCEVRVYESGQWSARHHFSDLQMVYLWIRRQMDERYNGNCTLRSFERTAQRLGELHPRGYSVAWTDRTEYVVYYSTQETSN